MPEKFNLLQEDSLAFHESFPGDSSIYLVSSIFVSLKIGDASSPQVCCGM